MIKSIKIQGLYGRFNYDIKFSNEDVTIITGPNGYGKTTILNIISWISKYKFEKIRKLEFKEINISADDKKFIIHKRKNNLVINGLEVLDPYKRIFINRDKAKKSSIDDYIIYKIDKELKLYSKCNNSNARDNLYSKFIMDEVIEQNLFGEGKVKNFIPESTKLRSDIKKSLGKVYFIQEQRLIKGNTNGEKDIVDVIGNLPEKFKKIITEVSNNYSNVSNNLDSTYPERLFQTEDGISEYDYQIKIQEMSNKFEKLKKYDISDMKEFSKKFSFNTEFGRALKVYFDDFDEKYRQYEDLIDKLDLFVESINSKLQFKEIKVSRVDGIKVIDDKKNEIKLKDLSSGEKQEIALFFELIFETDKGTTILIDEPELSLHVMWQKKFMNDIISVANRMELKIIVATHSPQIIGRHRDKQIDLGALYNGSNRFN